MSTCTSALRRSLLAILFLPVVLLGCGGGGSGGGGPVGPTDPMQSSVLELSTDWGNLTIYPNGHPFDADKALAAIVAGYAKGREQIGGEVDGFRLDGYHVMVMPEDWANGSLCGQHLRAEREIRIRVGVEQVLTHELQHMFAWDLNRFDDCKVLQDHAHGYDLHCLRLP